MKDSTLTLGFPAIADRTVTAVCDGVALNFDAEVLLMKQADVKLSLKARLVASLRDGQQASKVQHQVLGMLQAQM